VIGEKLMLFPMAALFFVLLEGTLHFEQATLSGILVKNAALARCQ
jgi:hypothetical protein